MRRPVRVGAVCLWCAAVLAAGACTPSLVGLGTPTTKSPTAAPPRKATPAAKPTATPTPTAASPTASAAATGSGGGQVFATPEAAAAHLYQAWQDDDEPAALEDATQGAVDMLFADTWQDGTYYFGGCGTATECDYNSATGTIRMTISPAPGGGYQVTDVDTGSAG